MLSAFETALGDRGSGSPRAALTVKCRLFQRGEGWASLQSSSVEGWWFHGRMGTHPFCGYVNLWRIYDLWLVWLIYD